MRTAVRAIAFDVNGTLVDIRTDERTDAVFRAVGHVLTYSGIDAAPCTRCAIPTPTLMAEQRAASAEEHPEFDAVAIWRTSLEQHATDYTRRAARGQAGVAAAVPRRDPAGGLAAAASALPARAPVLDALATRFPLAVVTDGQSA